MDQRILRFGLPVVRRLLQCIWREIRGHGDIGAQGDNPLGEHVYDEGLVKPALLGRQIRDVRHPQLVGAIGRELAINSVQRTRC